MNKYGNFVSNPTVKHKLALNTVNRVKSYRVLLLCGINYTTIVYFLPIMHYFIGLLSYGNAPVFANNFKENGANGHIFKSAENLKETYLFSMFQVFI